MQINTDSYRFLASKFDNRRRAICLGLPQTCQARHYQIQNKLQQIAEYLSQTANIYEQNETKNSIFKEGNLITSSNINLNFPSLLTKGDKKAYFSGYAQYSFKEATIAYKNDYINSSLSLNVGDAKINAEGELRVWKDKVFDPELEVDVRADVALLSGNLRAKIGNEYVNTNVDARGTVGALYAQAHCVLSKEEQTLEAGVGACALRGEAEVAFNIFGAKVTLTAEGSVGSAEAKLSYHHKNREWEFGSKLGFIAGLGFKVRVNY